DRSYVKATDTIKFYFTSTEKNLAVTITQGILTTNLDSKAAGGLTLADNGTAPDAVANDGVYTASYTLQAGNTVLDGAKIITAGVLDLAGNSLAPTAGVTLDQTAPSSLSLTINDTAGYTASTQVSLSLSATDASGSGLDKICFSNDGTNYSSWEDYNTAKTWTVTTADGVKTVHFKVKDIAGNEATAVSDTTTLDTTAPSGTISIANGDEYTTSAAVTLNLSGYADGGGSGLDKVCYSNDGSSYSSWENAAATKTNWSLTSGDGVKTVYYRLRDNVGNIGTYSDTIKLDTVAPTKISAYVIIDSGATYSTDTTLDFTWSGFTDNYSDIECFYYSFSNNGGTITGTQVFTNTGQLTGSSQGTVNIYVWAKDAAGNIGQAVNDTIIVDSIAPSNSATVVINGGAVSSSNTILDFTWSGFADTGGTGITGYYYSFTNNQGTPNGTYTTSTSGQLVGASIGTVNIYAWAKDAAGNIGLAASDSIMVDIIPTGTLTASKNSARINDTILFTAALNAKGYNVTINYDSLLATPIGAQTMADLGNGSYSKEITVTKNQTNPSASVSMLAKDIANNEFTASKTINLDNTPPIFTSNISNDADLIYKNLDTIKFASTWDDNNYTLSVNFSNIDSYYISGSENITNNGNNTYTIIYMINKNNTKSDNSNLSINITATDTAGNTNSNNSLAVTLDNTAPSVPVITQPTTPTNSSTINVSGAAESSSTVELYANGGYVNSATSSPDFSFSQVPLLEGDNKITARVIDLAGNISPFGQAKQVTLDTKAPVFATLNTSHSLIKTGTNTITFTTTETLQSNPTVTVNNKETTYDSLNGLTYTYKYPISANGETQGPTTIKIVGKDLSGNEGSNSFGSFTIDTTSPTSLSVIINDTTGYTAATLVSLALSASDGNGSGIDKMCFSNDGITYSSWEGYNTANTWTITKGDGTKTVYFKVKDLVGNESLAVTDTTTLDQAGPAGSIKITNGAEYATTATVILNLTYSDEGSGVDKVCYANLDNESSYSSWEDPTIAKNWTLSSGDGEKYVYYKIRDKVGHLATFVDLIKLDTLKPGGTLTANKTESIRVEDTIIFTAYLDTPSYTVVINYDGLLETPLGDEKMDDEGNGNYTIKAKVTNKNNDKEASVYIKATDTAGNTFTTAMKVELNNEIPPLQDDQGNEGVSINPAPVPVEISGIKVAYEVYVSAIKISGKVKGAKLVLVRGEVENSPVIIPRDDMFSKQVPLVVGKNEITIIIRDSADNEFVKTIFVVYTIPKATEIVGKEGKEVISPDKSKVEIPEDALIKDEKISIKPANKDEQIKPYETQQKIKLLGIPHEFGPVNIVFHRPVKVTLSYQDSDWDINGNGIRDIYLDGSKPNELDEGKFEIVFWDGKEWIKAGNSIVDLVNNTVSVRVNHFTIYDIGEFQGQDIPEKFNLYLSKNPFKAGSDTIYLTYDLTKDAKVTIKIFNLAGDLVRTLLSNVNRDADKNMSEAWDGLNNQGEYIGSGIYVYYFKAEYTDGSKPDIVSKPVGVVK
ncbi:hypothetical protein KJ849_00130, partial [bacterium]|nr:hypothetical protein [bacterium]